MKRSTAHRNTILVTSILMSLLLALGGCSTPSAAAPATDKPAQTQAQTAAASATPVAEESTLPIASTPITLTCVNIERAGYKQDNKVAKILSEKTGISLNTTWVAVADFATKQPLMLASGQLPDMAIINTVEQKAGIDIVNELGDSGQIVNFTKYLDKTPNIKAALADVPGFKELMVTNEGNMYAIPPIRPYFDSYYMSLVPQTIMITDSIFTKNSLNAPTTTDELLSVCKKLKELYPDSYPVLGRTTDYYSVFRLFASSFGVTFGSTPFGVNWDPESDAYKCNSTEDKFRAMLEYMHTFYTEGLLDPEFMTTSMDEFTDKLANNKGFVYWSPVSEFMTVEEKIQAYAADFSMKSLLPLSYNGKQGKYYRNPIGANAAWYAVVSAKSEHALEAVRYLDYMLSDECMTMIGYGVEGETYKVENGKNVFLPDVKSKTNPNGTVDVINDYFGGNNLALGFQPCFDCFASMKLSYPQKAIDTYLYYADSDNLEKYVYKPINFSLKPSAEQLETITQIETALNTYISETSYKFVAGDIELNDAEWDKFVAKQLELGAETLVKLRNELLAQAKRW